MFRQFKDLLHLAPIAANDGEIGYVQGLLVDNECRAIQYWVSNASNGGLGDDVLMTSQWNQPVNWSGTAPAAAWCPRKNLPTQGTACQRTIRP